MPEHNQLIGEQLHPPQPLTFTGDAGIYIPPAPGVLVVKTDVTPYVLYLSTGTTAGALAVIGAGGSSGGFDADTESFLARLDGTYTSTHEETIDALITYCKGVTLASGGSLWAATDGLWLRCLGTSADSRLNLKGDIYPITDVSGTFTAFDGMALDGVDDYFEVAISAANVTNNHFSGAYITQDGPAGCVLMYEDAGYSNFMECQLSDPNRRIRATISTGSPNSSFGPSVIGPSTMSSRFTEFFADVHLINGQNSFSEEGGEGPTYSYNGKVVFGAFSDPSKSGFLQNSFAACWVGITTDKGLTPAEAQGLNAAIETCVSALRT